MIYLYICRVFGIKLQPSHPQFIEIYRVGDNKRTANTSTRPHISDKSGTKNACKILLCWFIVMVWVPVCNNMYRYERHFGYFYHNPIISETVSIANNGPTRRIFFYWNTTTGNNSSTDSSLLRTSVKIKCKEYFSRWPVGVKSNNVALRWVSWLRNHLPHKPAHSRQPERQTIIDRMHTWQQC